MVQVLQIAKTIQKTAQTAATLMPKTAGETSTIFQAAKATNPFAKTAATRVSKSNCSPNELAFLGLRKKIATESTTLINSQCKANWAYSTNMSPDNMMVLQKATVAAQEVYNNPEYLTKLLAIKEQGVQHPTLQKHLNRLIKQFQNGTNPQTKEEILALTNKQNALIKKFSDKTISNVDYAKELLELVKERNAYAQKLGFANFFEMQSGMTNAQLDNILTQVGEPSKQVVQIARQHPEMIQQDMLRTQQFNKMIIEKKDTIPLSVSMYNFMGWDLSKMPIKIDITPREGKYAGGFCNSTANCAESMIAGHLSHGTEGLRTLNHEIGHAVYNCGISKHIPSLDRNFASRATTEGIAMMMERLPYREPKYLQRTIKLTDEVAKSVSRNNLLERYHGITRQVFATDFERQMYQNPDQDLTKLWYTLRHKHMGIAMPETSIEGFWARSVIHYTSAPATFQDYIKGEAFNSQVYQAAKSKLGALTENAGTAEYFNKNIFRHGSSKTHDEILQNMTGSNLTPKAFIDEAREFANSFAALA